MTDDVKALVAEAREWRERALPPSPWGDKHVVNRLAAALEAATVAPAKTVQEVLELLDDFHGDNRMGYDAYTNLHDAVALLDVRPAPAVDREALARVLDESDPEGGAYPDDGEPPYSYWYPQVDAIMAALGARDVRDVQAEALSGAALNVVAGAGLIPPPNGRHPAEAWLHDRAQAIREARSER